METKIKFTTFAIDYASTYSRTHFKFWVLSLILEVIYIVIYVKHTKSDYGRGYTLSNESDDQKAETNHKDTQQINICTALY
jgi:uncharacterized ion transporter superfamily protein YfcC